MSKIGEKQIVISPEIQVTVTNGVVLVKGKEGELSIKLPHELEVEIKEGNLSVKRKTEAKRVRALHGLFRTLISNAAEGVVKPWAKKLEIVGTGYNVKLQGEDIVLKVGFSHQVHFKKVAGIKFQVEGTNGITVLGVDRQLVGQVAHQIKMVRKPDVYKGKGIKYEGERLRIKPGKKAKAAGAA